MEEHLDGSRGLWAQRRQSQHRRVRHQSQYQAQRRREQVERCVIPSQPLALVQYLEKCHSLSLAREIVTDRPPTSRGEAAPSQTGRIYPRRIIPWTTFAREQEKVWEKLSHSPTFSSNPVFPSVHELKYVGFLLRPVNSESDLRNNERSAVEEAVRLLMNATYNDALLRSQLGLIGTIGIVDDSVSESIVDSVAFPFPKQHRRARRWGNREHQFCIYQRSKHQSIPTVAIEYKPAHTIGVGEMATALDGEIQPDRDIIGQEGGNPRFAAKQLTTTIITELFSYMLGKGVRYGYIVTGEAYIFLRIGDDPSCVSYSLCVPNLDVQAHDDMRLHRTSVAQVFAFVLQAIQSPMPCQNWHSDAEALNTWPFEYGHVLRSIPATVSESLGEICYKPSRWEGFADSPIHSRSRCLRLEDMLHHKGSDNNRNGSNGSNSSSNSSNSSRNNSNGDDKKSPQYPQNSSAIKSICIPIPLQAGPGVVASASVCREEVKVSQECNKTIQDRPYCTHECLKGLALGRPLDEKCPNAKDHGRRHPSPHELVCSIRTQLAVYRGENADCVPLYPSGSRGAVIKIRVSSLGYTFIAKGVESTDRSIVHRESLLYNRLSSRQGDCIPVCLGIVDLAVPYFYDCGRCEHFILLSYAGRPVLQTRNKINAQDANKIATALGRLHDYSVLHNDAVPRKVLFEERSGKFMMVGLTQAKFSPELRPLDEHRGKRRRVKDGVEAQKKDPFSVELRSLLATLS